MSSPDDRWTLLSEGSCLLPALGEEVPSEPAARQPRGTILSGDLSEMQPSDVLNFLHQGRRTGVLLSRAHEVERAVVLCEGNVAWACSTSPGERLGELVANLGLVGRDRVEAALRERARHSEHKRIGQILVESGLLAPDEVWRGLKHQVVEVFLGLLVMRSGHFVFLRGLDKSLLPAQLSLDTQGMLLDGLRRLDEMELYRTRIPDVDAVLKSTGKPVEARLPLQEQRVLQLVDGARSLADLAAMTALGEFETTKAAYKLVEAGYLAL
jgi:hypothetical protein